MPRPTSDVPDAPDPSPALPSFLIGGFEGADHRNSSGHPVDMVDVTAHASNAARDYARMRGLGIRVVRESVGWRRSEREGRFDFSCAERRAEAARNAGLTVIWTLWHYGWPDDLSLFDASLPQRFAAFAHAAAVALADSAEPEPIVSPVNEISFLAWAISQSSLIYPHRGGGPTASASGYAMKKRLVRAASAGMRAIRDVIPGARMLHVDPLVHIVAPLDDPALNDEALRVRMFQFQAWDMLLGLAEPELGGQPHAADLIGVNYYHGNQFELHTERQLHWHLGHERRMPFRALLQEACTRYRRTLIVAETSHFGIGRGRWLCDVAREVRSAVAAGVPVAGLCLYPVMDRPDWEHPAHWHRSGLWDRHHAEDGSAFERLDLPYLRVLQQVAREFDDAAPARVQTPAAAAEYALIVLLRGRWDDVPGQRRDAFAALAERWRIVLVEPPRPASAALPGRSLTPSTLRLITPVIGANASEDDCVAATVALLIEEIAALGSTACGVWLQSAMTLPVAGFLAPDVVVYEPDCIVALLAADPRHAQRDRALRAMAGVLVDAGDCDPRVAARIDDARRNGLSPAARAVLGAPRDGCARAGATGRPSRPPPAIAVECLIIGAGAAGLSAACHFGAGSVLVEREFMPGGSRRSVVDNGYRFDMAPGVIDVPTDELADLYQRLLGDNIGWHDARIAGCTDATAAPATMRMQAREALLTSLQARGGASALRLRRFAYPIHGGMQALVDGFLPLLHGELWRRANVVRIEPDARIAWLEDGRRIRYERMIATLPLPALVALLGGLAPRRVTQGVERLRTLALRCINIGVRGSAPSPDHWLVYPPAAAFDRVFLPGNASVHCNAPGGFAIACEIAHSRAHPPPANGTALIERCIAQCVASGLIERRDRVEVAHEIDMPVACVIDDEPSRPSLAVLEAWLEACGIAFTASRGTWETGRCHDALVAGRRAALAARNALSECRLQAAGT